GIADFSQDLLIVFIGQGLAALGIYDARFSRLTSQVTLLAESAVIVLCFRVAFGGNKLWTIGVEWQAVFHLVVELDIGGRTDLRDVWKYGALWSSSDVAESGNIGSATDSLENVDRISRRSSLKFTVDRDGPILVGDIAGRTCDCAPQHMQPLAGPEDS